MGKLLFFVLFFLTEHAFSQSCQYKTKYVVPYLDIIPRYHQANDIGTDSAFLKKDDENDSSLCFAAAAAQAIDVFRLTILNGNTNQFKPSSPFLMGSRFQHIYGTGNGSFGGLSDEVIKETFKLGNCEVLTSQSVYSDGLLTVRDEMEAVIKKRESGRASALATNEAVIGGAFRGVNVEFFQASYPLCQPGTGSRQGQDASFSVEVYGEDSKAITLSNWSQALAAAENSSLGPQVAVVQYCMQSLMNNPYSIEKKNCGWHFSAIVGRRCPAAGTCGPGAECQVLIRDSYKGGLPANTEYYDGIPNDQSDFWLPESKIRNAASQVTVIKRVQDMTAGKINTPTVGAAVSTEAVDAAPALTPEPAPSQTQNPTSILNPPISSPQQEESENDSEGE